VYAARNQDTVALLHLERAGYVLLRPSAVSIWKVGTGKPELLFSWATSLGAVVEIVDALPTSNFGKD
jgi:hypothetical protein